MLVAGILAVLVGLSLVLAMIPEPPKLWE
jgi:hypothetical protein